MTKKPGKSFSQSGSAPSAAGSSPARASGSLSVSQERLLSCYFDGECGFFRGLRVHRLLKKSAVARDFLESLRELKVIQERALAFGSDSGEGECDLWTRIARRLDEEEREAILLGRRQIRMEPRRPILSPAAEWWWAGALGLGLAGFIAFVNVGSIFGNRGSGLAVPTGFGPSGPGTLADAGNSSREFADATVRFEGRSLLEEQGSSAGEGSPIGMGGQSLLERGLSQVSLSTDGETDDVASRSVTSSGPITLASNGLDTAPGVGISRRVIPNSMTVRNSSQRPAQLIELDWLRSQGRVNLLPGPSSGSAIIWVRRQNAAPRSSQGEIKLTSREEIRPRHEVPTIGVNVTR